MDERKGPVTGGAMGPRGDMARPAGGPDPRVRERYDLDEQGRFETDSGRLRAGVDRTRRDIDQTVAAIQERLSPSRIMDRFMEAFTGGSGAGSRKVLETIRDNPIPAALIGAGLGWLMLERAGAFDRFQARGPRRERPTVGHGHDEDWLAPGAEYYPPGSAVPEPQSRQEPEHGQRGMAAKAADTMYAAREKAGAWAHSAREGIASARERLGDIGGRARERIGDMSHRAREGAMHLGEQARHGARVARERTVETYEEYPLAMGGLALAGGLILGLLFPATRREDRLMGQKRDELFERAKGAGEELLEGGKRVARAATQAAREEAEREDLTPRRIVEGVQQVAGRAAEAAQETAKEERDRIAGRLGTTEGASIAGRSSSGDEAGGTIGGAMGGGAGGEGPSPP